MASVDGPCPLLFVLWEEEEEEEEEASTSSSCADTTLWARVPLSLFVVWCAVFPSFVDRPEMLGIMAVMNQKDSIALFPAVACARLVLLVILHLSLFCFPCRQAHR